MFQQITTLTVVSNNCKSGAVLKWLLNAKYVYDMNTHQLRIRHEIHTWQPSDTALLLL